jgi:hypothetical protein
MLIDVYLFLCSPLPSTFDRVLQVPFPPSTLATDISDHLRAYYQYGKDIEMVFISALNLVFNMDKLGILNLYGRHYMRL